MSAQRTFRRRGGGLAGCLTVGPAEATAQALDVVGSDAKVVWAVKADPRAAPIKLAARIAARADIIVWSRGEAIPCPAGVDACGASAGNRLFIETRGSDGVALRVDGRETVIRGEPLATEDTTGAGDTFLGGLLAALIVDPQNVTSGVEAGMRAARTMLQARATQTIGSLEK